MKLTRMQREEQEGLRARVYIDGYNLYYGCLKGTLHKWLDPRALIEIILPSIYFEHAGAPISYRFQTPALKYFTAPILPAFASSTDSVSCQLRYHGALQAQLDDNLEIIRGYYDAAKARAHRIETGRPARECELLPVWKLTEKQSDVALALHAYSDAVRKEVDQIIVLTNDTDFAPAIRMIRDHTSVVVGLIAPIRAEGGKKVNADLSKHAHWVRSHITDEEFARSQLPSMVRRANEVFHKPVSWYPRPDLLGPILKEAKRVRGSEGAARKWLNVPCERLDNRIPIEMCNDDDSAQQLRAYMDTYVADALKTGVSSIAQIHRSKR